MPALPSILKSWRLWGVLALLALLGFQQLRVSDAKADAAEARAALASDRQRYAEDARTAGEAQRKIEADRQAENERIRDEAREQVARAEGDARRAADAADGLRREVARLLAARRAAGANPPAAAGSPTGSDPLDLLADLFGRADDRAGALALIADRARIAGSACERRYDALVNEVSPRCRSR